MKKKRRKEEEVHAEDCGIVSLHYPQYPHPHHREVSIYTASWADPYVEILRNGLSNGRAEDKIPCSLRLKIFVQHSTRQAERSINFKYPTAAREREISNYGVEWL